MNIETKQLEEEKTILDSASLMLIKEHMRQFLMHMGFESLSVECFMSGNDTLQVNIEAGEEGKLLIGNKGSHLHALQYMVRAVLRPHISTSIRVAVDVNGYRSRRESSLLGLAENAARKAGRTGRTIVMDPMPPADRRAIHAALAHRKDIATESLGEEPNRRVVVKPVFL